MRDGGGELTLDDLAALPGRLAAAGARRASAGYDVLSNPPPSSGGVLIAYGLALLERLPRRRAGSAEAVAALAEVMREQARARGGSFARDLHRGGLARRLPRPGVAARARGARIERHVAPARPSPRRPAARRTSR